MITTVRVFLETFIIDRTLIYYVDLSVHELSLRLSDYEKMYNQLTKFYKKVSLGLMILYSFSKGDLYFLRKIFCGWMEMNFQEILSKH